MNMKLLNRNRARPIHIPLALMVIASVPIAHAGNATEVSMQVIEHTEYPANVKSIHLPERISESVATVQEGLQDSFKKNRKKLKNELRTNLDNFHDRRHSNREQIKSFFATTLGKIEQTSDNFRQKLADIIAPNNDTD